MRIQLKILDHAKDFYSDNEMLPRYTHPGDAGLDLRSVEDVVIEAGKTLSVSTGISIWLGSGNTLSMTKIAGFIYPRSGLGLSGLVLANTVGVIDENYQGEIKVALMNRSDRDRKIISGDRIAQLVVAPVFDVHWNVVEEFNENTVRAEKGFGSSGLC